MARSPTRRAGTVALVVALLLSGCARPVGDFGRAQPSVVNDTLLPAGGKLESHRVKRPVSNFNLTDEEEEMRNRVWRFLIDPHVYNWFDTTRIEMQRVGLNAVRTKPLPIDRYYKWIHTERFASSHVRYAQLEDDVEADIETIPSTMAAICVVQGIDRQRGIASNGMPGLEDSMRAGAAARQAENNAQIAWFVRAARNRYDSYGYALDHLVVETPHEGAVSVNGALSELAIYVQAAEADDFCAADWNRHGGGEIVLPSRVLRSGDDAGS